MLEANGIVGVPVLSVSTLGIAGLRQRQADLLSELRALESPTDRFPRLGGPRTWHLVGHSTGGVDAALLLREGPLALARARTDTTLAGEAWGEWSDLVNRIDSVTTIAAPHFGTGLAESPLARFAGGRPSLAAMWDLGVAATDIARRGDLTSRIRFAMGATPGLAKMPYFLLQMALMNELARDLRPEVLGPISAHPVRRSAEGRVFSIATVAPRPGSGHPDKLFHDMWRWTHDGRTKPTSPTIARPLRLDDIALRLPTQRNFRLPSIDAGDNDGVVSTDCQVLGELIGVVIGDHVDVLGRYRRSSLIDAKVIDPGLLTSGAEFGDDEFFGLLVRIGERLASAMR